MLKKKKKKSKLGIFKSYLDERLEEKKATYSFSFTPPLSDLASLQSSNHNPLDFCAALPMVLLL